MVSQWMENGNINEFVKANPDADRLELVCICNVLIVCLSLMIAWLQLSDVTRGLIYLHGLGIIHGDLKAVCFEPLPPSCGQLTLRVR